MTASDVLTYLEQLGVVLTLKPDGGLHYRAPRAVMTFVIKGLIKTCKAPLTALLVTGEDLELPRGVSLPETDYRRFLTWQTGRVPASAQMMAGALPEPIYHDEPTPSETFLGRPCTTKACHPQTTFRSGEPASLYYRRSGICLRCNARAKEAWCKTRTVGQDEDLSLF
jgi:hypothetical protein